jgi:hypothetical protein
MSLLGSTLRTMPYTEDPETECLGLLLLVELSLQLSSQCPE